MPQLSNVDWNLSMMVLIYFLFFVNFLIHYAPMMLSYDMELDFFIFYNGVLKI
ncbi:ATP synthase F0 subunit 8 (mitochondrion) [Fragariocoptes setiger]|uniref:ATP synthase F0 subunit 8 n=1 Tax=Fragariocoptes setiger TaxID=1670756 RepID=A0ABQ7SDG2_9ACAR|nr:ATP synthase F0 subunit 8 [Fragariocoptes setiger]